MKLFMRQTYNENNFDEQAISCSACGWNGKGSDTNIIDLYGITKVKEVHCPKCDAYIAGIADSDYIETSGDAG